MSALIKVETFRFIPETPSAYLDKALKEIDGVVEKHFTEEGLDIDLSYITARILTAIPIPITRLDEGTALHSDIINHFNTRFDAIIDEKRQILSLRKSN